MAKHLATVSPAHILQVHSLVHQRLCCQGKAVLFPVHGTVDLHAKNLLNEVLQGNLNVSVFD